MIFDEILRIVAQHWPFVLLFPLSAYFLRNKFNNGLNKYPGPWLAAYTDLWRFFDALGRRPEHTHIQLHRELGDIVRIGPNILSFADPKCIKTIYGLKKGFTKSEFYPVQQAVIKGKRLPSLFSTTDEEYHAKYRRCVNSAFAMTSLVQYEPLVNSTIQHFLDQTERIFANTGNTCNFSQWLQFFAFDVVGSITWSKELGFVEKNEDVDGIVAFVAKFLSYAGPVGQMPILDLLLEKNPIKLFLMKHGLLRTVFPVTQFAVSQSSERSMEMQRIKEFGLQNDSNKPRGVDLLSKFTQAQHDHPEFMDDHIVLTSSISMVLAGSETTAISLSSVFYFLLKNPRCYEKLMHELDEAVSNGTITSQGNDIVRWSEAQKLPYLDAVIQESFRLHPAAGLLLERVVQAQGIEIHGEWIPGGTIVGCNAWVLHRRPEVFGEEVDAFIPERWIDASSEKLKEMKATMFQFGAGARTCIGKNISLLEMYKLVPSFLRRFKVELDHPDRTWKTHNGWFVRQLEFYTQFTARTALVGLAIGNAS